MSLPDEPPAEARAVPPNWHPPLVLRKVSRQQRRAQERRMRRGTTTYEGDTQAYVITPKTQQQVWLPPFTALTAGGVEQCARANGVYGDSVRKMHVREINASVQEAFGGA